MIDRWLNLPDWAIVATLVAIYSGGAIACTLISFAPWWRATVIGYQGIVAPFFVSSGTMFAFMTAFLGGAVHETMRSANQAVMQERQGIVQVIDLAHALPTIPGVVQLPGLAKDYVQTVLTYEQRLPKGQFSAPQAEHALARMQAAIADRDLGTVSGGAIQSAFLRATELVNTGRVARLSLSSPQYDELRWAGVILLGFLTQFSIAAVHLDRPRPQALALMLSTMATIVALSVIAMSERPFSGVLAVTLEPLRQVIMAH